MRSVAERLKPGGVLHVATDDVPYAEQIDEVLRGEPSLLNLHAPDGWADEVEGRPTTGYEAEWRAEGRPLHFFDYARPVDGPSPAGRSDGGERPRPAARPTPLKGRP